MDLYKFNLRCNGERIFDTDGTELPDDARAFAHGLRAMSEIMRHNERVTRHWLLEVCNKDGTVLFEFPFVEYDQTLNYLSPELRRKVERLSRLRRELAETIATARRTLLQSRAIQARGQGKPYLVAERGRRL